MTVIPIARYLVQFGIGGGSRAEETSRDGGWGALALKPEEDVARRIEAASASGREEGRAAVAAEFEARLEEERTRFAEQVSVERAAWLAAEGARLGEAMAGAMHQLETAIADSVAHVLRPFLTAALRDQTLAALKEALTSLLSGNPSLVRVTGPRPLIDALREGVGPARTAIDYVASDGVDVSVVADHTVIETRMQAWIDRFEQATARAAP